ncbi:MAG: RNA polymerase sigma factor [Planctomycetes bacterium]|nr:RNA polymerase sigma factor [Planctomycetota bacterium]
MERPPAPVDSARAEPSLEISNDEITFVRELARELVNRRDEADDLAQDVLLARLTHAPGAGAAPRSWLARVARNAAIDLFRRRSKRRHVALSEDESTRTESISSGELACAAEHLRAALAKLDEPYRIALELRFFHELPPREIARRLELPVETVRTRIKRGLERLRADLDRRAGSRGAWLGAFAAWLRETPLAPNGAPGTPLARHAHLGLRARSIAAAGAAALGAFWLAWLALGSRADDTRIAAADPTTPLELATSAPAAERVPLGTKAGGATPVTPSTADRGSTMSLADEQAASAGSSAIGRVRIAGESAARRATVYAWPGDRGRVREGRVADPLVVARSDADGSFALTGLPAEFVLYADDGERVAAGCLVVRAAYPKTYAGLELSLVPPASLTGTVREPGGRACAFSTVGLRASAERIGDHPTGRRDASYANALEFTSTCDAAGRFGFERVVPGRYTVLVDGRALDDELELGAGARVLDCVTQAPAPSELEARDVAANARVVDSSGAPLDDFDVALVACEPVTFDVERGEGGVFRLVARTTPDARLWVGAAKYAHRLLRLAACTSSEARIVLAAETEVSLRVVTARGTPLAGARVTLYDEDGEPRLVPAGGSRWSNVLRTDAEGRCRALALPLAKLLLVVESGDGSHERFRVDLREDLGGERELALAERALVVRGLGSLALAEAADAVPIEFVVFDAVGAALESRTGVWRDGTFAEDVSLRLCELELDARGSPSRMRHAGTPRPDDAGELRLALTRGASAIELRTERRVERLELTSDGALVWDLATNVSERR